MARDLLELFLSALRAHRLRSGLSVLGIAIGIGSVILLTTVGEGTRQYVLSEFTQFGTNVLAINPGKTETTGIPGVLGGTTEKLTIDDAAALERVPGVREVVPLVLGQARVEAGERGRSVFVYGVTAGMPELWAFEVRQGRFLPRGDPRRPTPVAVLGAKLERELFGAESALGEWVRAGGVRLRVVGVMAPKGRILGVDVDDAAYVPVATAMDIFNTDELMEIDVNYAASVDTDRIVADVTRVLAERHRGRVDFTVTSQEAMLEVFGDVMDIVTLGLGVIGSISLLVGAIGVLTMLWIAVDERTSEIGLLRAIGATRGQVLVLFLGEAVVLSGLGGLAGVTGGLGIALALRLLVPELPLSPAWGYVAAAVAASALTGLLAGVLPARRAAALDPIEALRAE